MRGTIFLDDNGASSGDGREDEPGTHAAGYSLLNMTNLRKPGTYDMNMAVVILLRPYQPGDEQDPLSMLKEPLVSEVHPIQ